MVVRARLPITLLFAAFALAACGNPVGTTPDVTTPDGAAPADGNASPDGGPPPPTDVTYWRNVAPIINAHCASCHAAGGIGPMPLGTYAEVSAAAPLIVAETAARRMPPWMPDTTDCRALNDSRALTAEQVATLARWVDMGKPEGSMADYVAPQQPTTARPLPPTGDLRVEPAMDYTPTTTETDDYHCFVMDPGLTEQRDVVGVRVTPGNPRIVHHVILFEVRAESLAELQRLDDAEPGPGYTCFGTTRIAPVFRAAPAGSEDLADFNQQMVVGWAPGGVPGYFPPRTGIRLKPGSRLVMQVHYNLSASTRGMSDRSRVDLYFAQAGQATGQAMFIPVAQQRFNVPAGTSPDDPAARVVANQPWQFPVRFFGAAPHMHLRGRSIRVDAVHADGTAECLINIPRWNFHWQQGYWYREPFRPMVATGARDTLRLTCTYDNTEANQPVVDGVRQPPRDLTWGEGTNDEMCLNFFYGAL